MKALTVLQPHASLLACGEKTSETRSRPAPPSVIGQHIAIHAGKAPITGPYLAMWPDKLREAVKRLMPDITGLDGRPWVAGIAEALPYGAVVATARVVDVGQVIVPPSLSDPDHGDAIICKTRYGAMFDLRDDGLGDYGRGRWVWLLDSVEQLDEPIPARGKQGFWDWDCCCCHWVDGPHWPSVCAAAQAHNDHLAGLADAASY